MAKKKRNQRHKRLADSKAKQESMKDKELKLNPFELKNNRKKQLIIGAASRRFEKGFPGMSKLKAIEKRKTTLLKDYLKIKRSNKFVDKRIGEHDGNISLEDKMMARFAAERQRNRSDIGVLDDDVDLTHYGHNLASIEKFDAPISDEDEDNKLDDEFVEKAHFGGFLVKKDSEQATKSRETLIAEIVAKSKERKELKHKEKEASQLFTDQLNDEWKNVQSLLSSSKMKKGLNDNDKSEPDNYDVLVRQLKFEIRAKASDPLKTAEQLAKKQQIENDILEGKLLKRMQMIDKTNSVMKHRSADDLDDDFETDNPKLSDRFEDLINNDPEDEENDDAEQSQVEQISEANDEQVLESLQCFIDRCLQENTCLSKSANFDQTESVQNSLLGKDRVSMSEQVQSLYDLANRSPSKCAHFITKMMKQNREAFLKSSRRNPVKDRTLSEMVLTFKVVGLLYPTSDFRHPVATFAMLLMAETLSQLDVNFISHLRAGIYICFLFLEFTQLSKRYVPECFIFLSNSLESLAKQITLSCTGTNTTPSSNSNTHLRYMALNHCVSLVIRFLKAYHLTFYDKLLDRIVSSISQLRTVHLPNDIKESVESLSKEVESTNIFKRKKIIRENIKQFSIKLLQPKLTKEDNKQKLSDKRLVRKHRSEMKGAMREIRKDNRFLASQQMKEQNERDKVNKRKLKELLHDVASESGFYKKRPTSRKNFK